jgi:hypothetical protein
MSLEALFLFRSPAGGHGRLWDPPGADDLPPTLLGGLERPLTSLNVTCEREVSLGRWTVGKQQVPSEGSWPGWVCLQSDPRNYQPHQLRHPRRATHAGPGHTIVPSTGCLGQPLLLAKPLSLSPDVGWTWSVSPTPLVLARWRPQAGTVALQTSCPAVEVTPRSPAAHPALVGPVGSEQLRVLSGCCPPPPTPWRRLPFEAPTCHAPPPPQEGLSSRGPPSQHCPFPEGSGCHRNQPMHMASPWSHLPGHLSLLAPSREGPWQLRGQR